MNGKRLSCKKLALVLNETGFLPRQYTPHELRQQCEAYGRDVCCYLATGTLDRRFALEAFLRANNMAFNADYCHPRGNCSEISPVVEIGVSYFKAHHWNE